MASWQVFSSQQQGNSVMQWIGNRHERWVVFKHITIRVQFCLKSRGITTSKPGSTRYWRACLPAASQTLILVDSAHAGFVKGEDLPRLRNKALEDKLSKAQEAAQQLWKAGSSLSAPSFHPFSHISRVGGGGVHLIIQYLDKKEDGFLIHKHNQGTP